MIKMLLCGLCGCAAALGSNYASTQWMLRQTTSLAPHEEAGKAAELNQTKVLNVPVIADGALQGYISAQFSFTADEQLLKTVGPAASAMLLDEAFRALYGDESINFRHLEKYDLNKFSTRLLARMKERLGSETIKDLMINQFAFIGLSEMHKEH